MPRLFEYDEGCVPIKWAELGILATNVYFIEDGEGGVIVVDPADNIDAIMDFVGDRPVSAILLTHGHYDHMCALAELRERTGAPVIVGEHDAHRVVDPQPGFVGRTAPACEVDKTVTDGEDLRIGKTTWRVMHTPGHTEGCVCYYLEPSLGTNTSGDPVLMSGDTLFHGTVGRTDLEGGSMADMAKSLEKLAELPDETVVFPGHNSPTTIKLERGRTIDAIRNATWTRP